MQCKLFFYIYYTCALRQRIKRLATTLAILTATWRTRNCCGHYIKQLLNVLLRDPRTTIPKVITNITQYTLTLGCNTKSVERLWGISNWRNKRRRDTVRQYLQSCIIGFMWQGLYSNNGIFTAMQRDIYNSRTAV